MYHLKTGITVTPKEMKQALNTMQKRQENDNYYGKISKSNLTIKKKKVEKKGRFKADISFLEYQNTIYETQDSNNNCSDLLVIKNEQNHCDFEETGQLIADGVNIVPQHSKRT